MTADNSPYVKPSPAREQEMLEVVDRLVDADSDEEDDKRQWVRPRPPMTDYTGGGTRQPDGSVLAWDDGVTYKVYPGGRRVPFPEIPKGWVQIGHFPSGKYVVVEVGDGWAVYAEDHHGAFS